MKGDFTEKQIRQRALIYWFMQEAPERHKSVFVWSCVDRAVREYAPMLIFAGRGHHGASEMVLLQNLPELTSARHAQQQGDARPALLRLPTEEISDALHYADAQKWMDALTSIWHLLYAEANNGILEKELDAEEAWILRHNARERALRALSKGKKYLSDLDAYIANGLLLGDDE